MKKLLVIMIALVSVVFCKPTVRFDANAKAFLHNKARVEKYRSGLFVATDTINKGKLNRENRIALLTYVSNEKDEKSVGRHLDTFSEKLKRRFHGNVKKYGEMLVIDSCDVNVKFDIGAIKKRDRAATTNLLNALFPNSDVDQLDLFAIHTLFEESEFESRHESGYIVSYSRIYDGRIIRNGKNYLDVLVGNDGIIKHVEAKWQDLYNSDASVRIDEQDTENQKALNLVMELDYAKTIVQSTGSTDTLDVTDFEVKGVAKAWCEIELENGLTLIPCLSYTGVVRSENGEEEDLVVDAPYSINYLEGYRE